MRTEQLKSFIAIVEQGGFTKAAEHIHIAQPAISQQIKSLEAELGFDLFDRAKGKSALTVAGSQFYKDAVIALEHQAHALRRGRALSQGLAGKLTVGVFGFTQINDLQPAKEFLKLNPEVQLEFKRADVKNLHEELARGCYDIVYASQSQAILSRDLTFIPDKTCELRLLVAVDSYLASRPSVSIDDFRALPNIFACTPEEFSLSWYDSILPAKDFADVLFVSDQDLAILMVEFNLGVQVAPTSILSTLPPDIRALKIDGDALTINLGWIHYAKNQNATLARFVSSLSPNAA